MVDVSVSSPHGSRTRQRTPVVNLIKRYVYRQYQIKQVRRQDMAIIVTLSLWS